MPPSFAEEGDETRVIRSPDGREIQVRALLQEIYEALAEKGYDPIRQLASYLTTGEPAYITAHKGARVKAARLDRNAVLEELLRHYLT
ncbi:MAG: IreB family regulatory phosphoprotein [Clostridiales bacterium]|nr:IreB family regulatory phosphoprotein [Clostridiales bacterium]